MKVLFENSYGERRIISEIKNEDEVYSVINNFLKQHNYKSPYVRSWEQDGYKWYDVGSHSEFFLLEKK